MTRAVDVWSCGLVLYELFTGERLLDASTATLAAIGGEPGTPWERQAESVDALVQKRLAASEHSGQLQIDAAQILRGMLKAEPTERVQLRDLLQRRFFRPSMSTREMQQVTLLESSARRRTASAARTHASERCSRSIWKRRCGRRCARSRSASASCGPPRASPTSRRSSAARAPRTWASRLASCTFRATARPRARRQATRGSCSSSTTTTAPALELDAHSFIELLAKLTPIKNSLECIFLNACSVYSSLAVPIHNRFPHISVIAYSTPVEDMAAATFAQGFYTYIGNELEAGRKPAIRAAFEAAEEAWNSKGLVQGDPLTMGRSVHGVYHFLEGQPKRTASSIDSGS